MKKSEKMVPYLLLLPVILVLGSVMVLPFCYNAVVSFMETKFFSIRWTFTLDNYIWFFQWRDFWNTTLYTIVWVGASVFFMFLFGLLTALVLNEAFKGRAIVRTVVLVPWVLPGVVVGLMWKWLFQTDYGIINIVLYNLKLISSPLEWLGNETLARVSVIIVNIWKGFPFYALLLLAGLQTVPLEEIEAAKIDGASFFQITRYITVPHLKRLIIILTILMSVWTFNAFELIYSITEGGPSFSTTTIPIAIYRVSFKYNRLGEAAVIAMIGLIMEFLLILSLAIWLRRQEE